MLFMYGLFLLFVCVLALWLAWIAVGLLVAFCCLAARLLPIALCIAVIIVLVRFMV